MSQTVKMRQTVDWSAAAWAGFFAGSIYIIIDAILAGIVLDSPLFTIRLMASIVLGEGAVPPPTTFVTFVVGLIVHLVFSMVFATLIAFIIHRWGILVGLLGGGAIGLAIYVINIYTFSFFFPWFYSLSTWITVVGHIIFGATAGVIYEVLEIEEFVPVEA